MPVSCCLCSRSRARGHGQEKRRRYCELQNKAQSQVSRLPWEVVMSVDVALGLPGPIRPTPAPHGVWDSRCLVAASPLQDEARPSDGHRRLPGRAVLSVFLHLQFPPSAYPENGSWTHSSRHTLSACCMPGPALGAEVTQREADTVGDGGSTRDTNVPLPGAGRPARLANSSPAFERRVERSQPRGKVGGGTPQPRRPRPQRASGTERRT